MVLAAFTAKNAFRADGNCPPGHPNTRRAPACGRPSVPAFRFQTATQGGLMALCILLGTIALLIIALITRYNGLVRGRNAVDEAWSGIDVQLKRRHDLVPNLISAVKAYASHEKAVFEQIIEARARSIALRSLFTVAEKPIPSSRRTKTSCNCRKTSTNWKKKSRWPAATTTVRHGIRTTACSSSPATLWREPSAASARFAAVGPVRSPPRISTFQH